MMPRVIGREDLVISDCLPHVFLGAMQRKQDVPSIVIARPRLNKQFFRGKKLILITNTSLSPSDFPAHTFPRESPDLF
jgi:hypothetical protein